MRIQRRLVAIGGTLALTLGIAIAAVMANSPLSVAAAPTASSADRVSAMTDFVAKLAANLGISQDQLVAAVKKTDLQMIDEAVAAGQLTTDQANAARDRINNSPNGIPPFGIGGRHGHDHRGFGDHGALLDATARYFGITSDQLRQDLHTAKSLQGVAAKYGKDNDSGKAGLKAALSAALRQSLTARGIASAQIDQHVAAFEQNFDRFYTMSFGDHGPRNPDHPVVPTPATPQTTQSQ